jgi:AcrR family transcriptional regulator
VPAEAVVEDRDRHEQIAAIQRARLLAAVAEACAEHGAANLTVGHIVDGAGVSRRTFYDNFESREDCVLAAVEQAVSCLSRRVTPTYRAPGPWLERMRAAVTEALGFFDEEPHTARLLLVETLGLGERVLLLRQTVLAKVVTAIDEARTQAKSSADPPPLAAEGTVGGALAVLHARLLDPGHGPLVALGGQLMSILILPYLGTQAARRELTRRPPPRTTRKPPSANPLPTLDMRLTYRTVRVLSALAGNPHASNRELATAAGIQDQGQTSKLLMRLQRLELIHNAQPANHRGMPNAWTLTDTGARIQQAIGAQDTDGR